MPSDPTTAFVWIWLPGADEPVVCGRLDDERGAISFTYAQSYLGRPEAMPLYEPELPLGAGPQFAASGNRLPLCIDDSMPDSWGRRLINRRLDAAHHDLPELTYLLSSDQGRVGALEFHPTAERPPPLSRQGPTLEELADAANRIDQNEPINPVLEAALLHGTSVGGARPKALLRDGDRHLIAKFSSSSDTYPVVQGEFVAMELARRAGLRVAPVQLTKVHGRWAVLVERFDRAGSQRRHVVSALTILGLSAYLDGRYASYAGLSDQVRARFDDPAETLRELFGRISFNILCGNTDDHGRNHAAFVRAGGLELTPAYDICPQLRSGQTAAQAMAYSSSGDREARTSLLVDAAGTYRLDRGEAQDLVDAQTEMTRDAWDEVCDAAELTAAQRADFLGRQFLNPLALAPVTRRTPKRPTR